MTTLTTEQLINHADYMEAEAKAFEAEKAVNAKTAWEIRAALLRLIEVEAENVRLHTEIDASAFSLTPAMVQARNDQLCAENKRLRAELAAIKDAVGPNKLEYLAENTRFKMSFSSKGGTNCFWNFKHELDDRWVALVPAEDDNHMRILRHAEHLAARNVELVKALREAKTGLEWYQSNHPESVDGSDDEAMGRIEAALAANQQEQQT